MKGIIENVTMGVDKSWCQFSIVGDTNKYMISFLRKWTTPKDSFFENFIDGATIKLGDEFASIRVNGEKYNCRGKVFVVPDETDFLAKVNSLQEKFCVVYKKCLNCPYATVTYVENEVVKKQCILESVDFRVRIGNQNGFVRNVGEFKWGRSEVW